MAPTFYAITAMIAALLAATGGLWYLVARSGWGGSEKGPYGKGERLPMTPLQKRAWLALGILLLIVGCAAGVLIAKGPTACFADDTIRILLEVLILLGCGAYLMLLATLIAQHFGLGGGEVLLDERDTAILTRATFAQVVAMQITTAVWAIVLTEVYWDRGQIPVVFPNLIFWSTFLVSLLALPIGILSCYRRG